MGKKERIGAHQERSDKENLSVERQQHKKCQQIEYEESNVWTWAGKNTPLLKNLNLLVNITNENKRKERQISF